jgi:hypothetical protein
MKLQRLLLGSGLSSTRVSTDDRGQATASGLTGAPAFERCLAGFGVARGIAPGPPTWAPRHSTGDRALATTGHFRRDFCSRSALTDSSVWSAGGLQCWRLGVDMPSSGARRSQEHCPRRRRAINDGSERVTNILRAAVRRQPSRPHEHGSPGSRRPCGRRVVAQRMTLRRSPPPRRPPACTARPRRHPREPISACGPRGCPRLRTSTGYGRRRGEVSPRRRLRRWRDDIHPLHGTEAAALAPAIPLARMARAVQGAHVAACASDARLTRAL